MRKLSFSLLSFLMLCQLSFGQTDVDFMEQVKRDARKNNHIEKHMQGEVVNYLYKGVSQALTGFVFRSNEDQYYHVRIRQHDGSRLMPFITRNESIELTVTGDPVLLKEILYYKDEYLRIQNTLDIKLTGIAHFKKVVSSAGEYTYDKTRTLFSTPGKRGEFVENVAIVKRKRAPDNQVFYALENGDTILVPIKKDKSIKGRESISYFRSNSVFGKGSYFKSPNTYTLASMLFDHPIGRREIGSIIISHAVVILEKAEFVPLSRISNMRGLLSGYEVEVNGNKESMFFNVKNGEKIMATVKENEAFSGYYKNIGEDSIVLYVTGEGENAEFLDNRDQPFLANGNYEEEEVTLKGKVTSARFADTKLLNYKGATGYFANTINAAKLKYLIVNDSIFVGVKEIVALNIQDKIKEGMDITIKGWMRKKVSGEVNLKGFTIMAVNAFTIGGKTFAQKNYNIKRTL